MALSGEYVNSGYFCRDG